MTPLLIVLTLALSAVLVLVCFVQLLYLESLRLRMREFPALTYFKDTLQDRLGLEPEQGAIRFSLLKHCGMIVLGILVVGAATGGGPWTVATVVEALLIGLGAMLVCTYALPQLLYRRSSGAWSIAFLPVVKILALLIKPLAMLLNFFETLVSLGESQAESGDAPTQAEEIEALITAGTEEGIIEEDDRKLIHSVVALKDKTVRESMTPRPQMVSISVDRSLDDLRQLVINEQFSRIPVWEGSIDHILGFVHVRDLFELTPEQQATLSIRDLLRETKTVPEMKPVDDLLRDMQENGIHMVIVADEYGNTAGLATMEDLVEEIVGEIRDEHEPDRDVEKEGDNSFVVAGSYDVDNLRELVHWRGASETEAATVGGLVAEWLGRVPKKGECVERDGIRVEVLAGNELRVDKVRVSKLDNPAHV